MKKKRIYGIPTNAAQWEREFAASTVVLVKRKARRVSKGVYQVTYTFRYQSPAPTTKNPRDAAHLREKALRQPTRRRA